MIDTPRVNANILHLIVPGDFRRAQAGVICNPDIQFSSFVAIIAGGIEDSGDGGEVDEDEGGEGTEGQAGTNVLGLGQMFVQENAGATTTQPEEFSCFILDDDKALIELIRAGRVKSVKVAVDVEGQRVTYLKELRLQKDLTMGDVVKKTRNKLDKTFVSRVEAGERKLSFKGAYYLSKIYDISLDELAEMAIGKNTVPVEAQFDVSTAEKKLLLNYRKLLPAIKEAVIKIIEHLVLQHQSSEESKHHVEAK